MTISEQTARSGPYSGDGSTVAFAYTFLIDDEDELVVVVADGDGDETVQTITTDYTVSGVGNNSGGTVTFVTAPAATETVSMRRDTARDQGLDLQNRGAVVPQTVEDTIDEVVKMVQDLDERAGRAVLAKLTSNIPGLELPTPDGDAVIGWNSGGTALQNKTNNTSGYVGLPASSTNNAFARFDGTSGKTIQNSGVLCDDNNDVTGLRRLYLDDGVFIGGTDLANKIDDFEIGTWTPALADAETGGNEATFSQNTGLYIKVGNKVTLYCILQLIDTTGLTAGNNIWITGLPFTQVSATLGGRAMGAVWVDDFTFSGYLTILAKAGAAGTSLNVWENASAAAANRLTVAGIASGTARMIFTCNYTTA